MHRGEWEESGVDEERSGRPRRRAEGTNGSRRFADDKVMIESLWCLNRRNRRWDGWQKQPI